MNRETVVKKHQLEVLYVLHPIAGFHCGAIKK